MTAVAFVLMQNSVTTPLFHQRYIVCVCLWPGEHHVSCGFRILKFNITKRQQVLPPQNECKEQRRHQALLYLHQTKLIPTELIPEHHKVCGVSAIIDGTQWYLQGTAKSLATRQQAKLMIICIRLYIERLNIQHTSSYMLLYLNDGCENYRAFSTATKWNRPDHIKVYKNDAILT